MTPARVLLSSTALLTGLLPLVVAPAVRAACVATGSTTVCNDAAPNPSTSRIGNGPSAAWNDRTVVIRDGAILSTGDNNAISLNDRARITVESGGLVQNNAVTFGGTFGTGKNTIEFAGDGLLTVEEGGSVLALGSQGSAEPVNFHGIGNTIVNNGTIRATSTTAIWSQNLTGLNTVINNATGVIQAPGTVIGTSGNGALDFTNRGTVIGDVRLAGGQDTLRFFTGSTITGDYSGGAGEDRIFLSGNGASSLAGSFVGFETLTKNDPGTWTLTGSVSGVSLATVEAGTLVLTGNNAGYTGRLVVEDAGIVEARAQSLPPKVENDGLVRFAQTDDGTYAGTISGDGAVEKTAAGVLTLAPSSGANSYSGGTRLIGGVLAVAADPALGAASGGVAFDGGTLRFDADLDLAATRAVTLEDGGGTINTQGFAGTLVQAITGAGGLTKTGAGTLTLAGVSGWSGETLVDAGTLVVGDAASPGAAIETGLVTVQSGATLGGYGRVASGVENFGTIAAADAVPALAGSGSGRFTVAGTLTNRGLVDLRGEEAGNALEVTDYVGRGGTLAINAVLGEDGSPADQLVVAGGRARGATALVVTNLDGAGAQSEADGIRVVDAVDGGSTKPGAFTLVGDFTTPDGRPAVVGGAFAYSLYRNGVTDPNDNDWYLRTQALPDPNPGPPDPGPGPGPGPDPGPGPGPGPDPAPPLFQPGAPVYEALPQALAAMNRLPTLQQRVGNRFWSGAATGGAAEADMARAVWARLDGAAASYEPDRSTTDLTRSAYGTELQVGADLFGHERDDGSVVVGGFNFSYAETRNIIESPSGDGDIDATGYGIGGTVTWYAPDGTYADGQARYAWYDSDLSSRTLGELETGVDGTGVAFSVEAGRRVERARGSVTPQMQLSWSSVDFDGFTDANDAEVEADEGDSLAGRLGITWDNERAWADRKSHLYGIANLYYEFLDGTEVSVGTGAASVTFADRDDRLWGGLGVGGTFDWNGGRTSIYGEGAVNSSLENLGDSYALTATAGFRYTW